MSARGHVPAVAFARVSLARKIILGRRRASWTQAELARRSRLPVETVNRLEKAKTTPTERTVDKIAKALATVGIDI